MKASEKIGKDEKTIGLISLMIMVSLMILTASLIHIVSEFRLLVSGGGHPLVVRGGDGGRVRGVQTGLQQG